MQARLVQKFSVWGLGGLLHPRQVMAVIEIQLRHH